MNSQGWNDDEPNIIIDTEYTPNTLEDEKKCVLSILEGNDNLFIYRTKNMVFYIPLWHKEIALYDDKINMEYVFIIIPDFVDIKNKYPIISQVCIDDSNNVYIRLTEYIPELIIGSKVYTFPRVMTNGQCIFNGEGVSHTNNEKNIYDISSRSNVFFKIY